MFKASFITSAEQIEEELAEMQSFLEISYPADNTSACKERMNTLLQHMARSGKLKADAEHHYSTMLNGSVMSSIKELAESTMNTSTINEYIKSHCREYKQLIVWADRVNRSCTHQVDALRTIISFAKQERVYGNM